MFKAELSPGIVGGIAAVVIVPIVLRLLAKAVPYRPPQPVASEDSLEELGRRYRQWETASIVPIFLFTAGGTFLWYALFAWIRSLAYARFRSSTFFLSPPAAFWFLPAFFLGILIAGLLTHLLYAHLLGGRYAEYTHYTNLRFGFDSWRVTRAMTYGILAVCVLVLPLALDSYTVFTEEGVRLNAFLSLAERQYPYSEVIQIRSIARFKAPSGEIVNTPHFDIRFRDGASWSSRGFHEAGLEKSRAIVGFVSKRSGKPITQHDIAPE